MSFNRPILIAAAVAAVLVLAIAAYFAFGGRGSSPDSTSVGSSYRFELAGEPQKTGPGVSVVSVRLVQAPTKSLCLMR